MTTTSSFSDASTDVVVAVDVGGDLDLDGAAPPCPEAMQRVTAKSADLIAQGRRVTLRELSRLTGLEPPTVDACVAELVRREVLQPAGAAPHHYVFAPGRWPLG